MLVANYNGGSVALLPIEPDGSLAPAAQVVQHTGRGPIADRQATRMRTASSPIPQPLLALGGPRRRPRVSFTVSTSRAITESC